MRCVSNSPVFDVTVLLSRHASLSIYGINIISQCVLKGHATILHLKVIELISRNNDVIRVISVLGSLACSF